MNCIGGITSFVGIPQNEDERNAETQGSYGIVRESNGERPKKNALLLVAVKVKQ